MPGPAWRHLVKRIAAATVVVAGAATLVAGPAAADERAGPGEVAQQRAAQERAERPGRAQRLLLFTVPGLTWADFDSLRLPTFERFFADAAIADLAPRSVLFSATPGDAYLTIAAGTRTASEPLVDGLQLAADEQYLGSRAGEVFRRRTGVDADGAYVSLPWPTLQRVNGREPYDAVLGLLGGTLDDAGVATAVVANAGGSELSVPSIQRQAALALTDERGVLSSGALGAGLSSDAPGRPFGVRQDHDRTVESFREFWDPARRAVVLVEASDAARVIRYRPFVASRRFAALRTVALMDADALFRRLLDSVDPARDAVAVIAPYIALDRGLGVAGLRAPGIADGYLRSASTQRSGVVTLVDVAPTVLDTLGVARPSGMEGRPFQAVASGRSFGARQDRLVSINAASRFREQLLFPTTLALVLLLALVAAAAVVVIAGERSNAARRRVGFAALVVLAGLPASYLARAFPLEELGSWFYWAFLPLVALLFAIAGRGLARRTGNPAHGLMLVLALVLGVPVVDVLTGSNLHLSSAFGYSPTGNSRLYGISNYSFGQLASASCLLAALGAFMVPSRAGRIGALALLAGVLVVLGVPIWGSDVGGVLAFTPTILAFGALLFRYRVRLWGLLTAAGMTAVAVTAFGLIDLARPPGQRAHLGRLFERIGNEGVEPLISIVTRKFAANLRVSTSSFWVAAIPIALLFWFFLRRWPKRPLAEVHDRIPTLHAALVAALIAAVLGSLVNDSGAIVGGVAMLVVTATLAFLATEPAVR